VVLWVRPADPALLDCARALQLDADGAGLIEVPDGANGRGLVEVGCMPGAGPGLTEVDAGLDASGIRESLADGSLEAAFLINADPVRDFGNGPAWSDALGKAKFLLCASMFADASARHADVVFPAEAYAEKEGTVTHPDGRLQRLRPGIPHPGGVRPMWEVLAELSALLGDETGIDSTPEALATITSEVPFYAGITPEEIGGLGIRWQERKEASALLSPTAASPEGTEHVVPTHSSAQGAEVHEGDGGGGLLIGTYRDLWAAEVTDRSPALRFLAPRQALEIAPADAERLGVGSGAEVDVRSNGTSVRARVSIHERIRPGSGFLIEGLGDAAGGLRGKLAEVSAVGGAE
jgi:NADH-quinone oxidoreductase subunit G